MCLNACMVCRKSKMPTFYCGHRAENYLTSSGRVHETRGYKHVASVLGMCSCPPHQFLVVLKSGLLKTLFFLLIAHDVRLHTGELRWRTVLCPNRHFPWRFGSQRCFLTFSGDQWCHNHLVIHRCWTEVSKLNNPPSAEEYDLIWISCIIVVR